MPELNDLMAFGIFMFFIALAIALPNIDTMIADFSTASKPAITLARTGLFLVGTGVLFSRL